MEEPESKRKLACDSCRKKKMKCEWDDERVCNRCAQRRLACIPHPTQPRRKERKPNTYLSSLEDRLRRMEEAMKKSAAREVPPVSLRASAELAHESIPDQMSSLKINDDGSSLFVGAASSFSIISPAGVKWITEMIGNNDFERLVSRMPSPNDFEAGAKLWTLLSDADRFPLPTRDRALVHFDTYFQEGFNSIFPIFDEVYVRERFKREYPVSPTQDVAWYAILNLIFGISAMVSGKITAPTPAGDALLPVPPRQPLTSIEKTNAFSWFRNAMSLFCELQFVDGSFPAFQAMIAMCFVLQTHPNPSPSLVVASSAMRLAQSLGLHRHLPHLKLTPTEAEQRRNLFWIGLIVERQITIRMGRPSVIHDDDIGIDLPKPFGPSGIDYGHLRQMAQVILIQGKIFNSLYSAKSLAKPRIERLRLAGLLDEELQYWRDQLPAAVRPGCAIVPAHGSYVPIVLMHFAYFNSLTIIHRVSAHHGPWTENIDDSLLKALKASDINPRVLSGGAICVDAARDAIKLLVRWSTAFHQIDLNMVRLVAYHPLGAALTMFANILQKPLDHQALNDIELMKTVPAILSNYAEEADANTLLMIELFTKINQLAEAFVLKSRREHAAKQRSASEAHSTTSTMSGPFVVAPSEEVLMTDSRQQSRDNTPQSYTSPQFGYQSSGVEDGSYVSPYNSTPSPNNTQPTTDPITAQQLQDTPSNDPFTLLDQSQAASQAAYQDPANLTYDASWMNENDVLMQPELFMPNDGNWYLPMSNCINPWDTSGQSLFFTNMQDDAAAASHKR